jgi:hypothetical protein
MVRITTRDAYLTTILTRRYRYRLMVMASQSVEEEATRAQTAFGKEPMFNRKEPGRRAMDDVLDVFDGFRGDGQNSLLVQAAYDGPGGYGR